MLASAKQVRLQEEESDEEQTMVVWEGHLTKLITSQLNYSTPFYTSITQGLKRMGCIRQLRRGGGNSESQWEIICEPSEEAFWKAHPKIAPKVGKMPQVEQQVASLATRMNRLEEDFRNIMTALAKEEANG